MRDIVRKLAVTAVLALALVTTGCDLCTFDPDAHACTAEGAAQAKEIRDARLIAAPDTVWLFGANDAGVSTISVRLSDSSYKYKLSISSLPSDLSTTLTPDSVYGDKTASLRIGTSAWPGQTHVVMLEGRGKLLTLRRGLVVVREKPFRLLAPSEPVTIQAGAIGFGGAPATFFFGPRVTVAQWFIWDATLQVSSPPGILTSLFPTGSATFSTEGSLPSVAIRVNANVPPAVYDVMLRASYKGFVDTLLIPVTVTAPPPPGLDFALRLSENVVTVDPSDSVTTDITIAHTGTSSGAAQLTHSSLPQGITIDYPVNPVSTTGSAVVKVASNVAAGRYPVRLEGTINGETRIAVLTIVVTNPDYRLSATPSILTIPRGGAKNLSLGINRLTRSIKAVNLSAQNEPNGIKATFANNPEPRSASDVTVSVGSIVPTGTYSFQLVGEALGIRRMDTVTVIVTNPTVSISMSPTALTLQAGGSPDQTFLVVRGPSYQVGATITVPKLPNGVSVTITPSQTVLGGVVIEFTASASATAGPVTVNVHVVVDGVTYIMPITLTIQRP